MENENKKNDSGKMTVIETCPHCETTNELVADENQMIAECSGCGKCIVLCDKCLALNPDVSNRPCDKCKFCDLANFMNHLRGFCTTEQFLAAMNPPLTDMTTGLPEGAKPTLYDYIDDTYGDDVNWDVKYWDIYRLVEECFLNASSSEDDCRDFVQEIIEKNNA